MEESIGQEIKYRLNNYLSSEELKGIYAVTSVIIELEREGGNNENAAEYTLKRIRVVVWEHTEGTGGTESVSDTDDTGDVNNIDKVDKIQVDKINITSNSIEENEDKVTDNLRGRFCSALGMEEEYMEVVVYGAH